MSYSSTGNSFTHNNWMEGWVMSSRPTRCVWSCAAYPKKTLIDPLIHLIAFDNLTTTKTRNVYIKHKNNIKASI